MTGGPRQGRAPISQEAQSPRRAHRQSKAPGVCAQGRIAQRRGFPTSLPFREADPAALRGPCVWQVGGTAARALDIQTPSSWAAPHFQNQRQLTDQVFVPAKVDPHNIGYFACFTGLLCICRGGACLRNGPPSVGDKHRRAAKKPLGRVTIRIDKPGCVWLTSGWPWPVVSRKRQRWPRALGCRTIEVQTDLEAPPPKPKQGL